jgi:hypothetical protein
MKPIFRLIIRIIAFLVIYIPLFTIPFFTGQSWITVVIVFVAFYFSKHLQEAIILKWFSK